MSDSIRYDILVQEALRSVMRRVLTEVAQTGLPGDHHFFITFDTNAPGVKISPRLKEKYAEQMTIVLQFQFWDLKVTETGFQVGLSFNDVAELLIIPFAAVRGFYDPHVNFELEFDITIPSPVTAMIESVENRTAPATEKTPTRDDDDDGDKPTTPNGGGEVVSLESFRRKK